MPKKLRKRLRQRRLAAVTALAIALSYPAAPAGAAIPGQSFADGQPHTITDNIVATATYGLYTNSPGTSAIMRSLSITAGGGANSYGAYAANNGAISLTNVAVTTTGPNMGFGLYTDASGGSITMTGGSIVTAGLNGRGAFAQNGGVIILNDVAIRTGSGDASQGVAIAFGGVLRMTGGSITTTNDNSSVGALASGGSNLYLTNVAITTTGSNSDGLRAYGLPAGGGITMTGGSITTTGASAGARVESGAIISLTDTAITASNIALLATGGTINASVSGQSISGNGALAFTTGGAINLTASGGSRLYGVVSPAAGIINFTLNNGAAWTMPANSDLPALTLGGGAVMFTAPATPALIASYKTLNVNSLLTGSEGAFYLNANLAASDAVTNLADTVTVRPAATAHGAHQLFVRNWGGVPANPYQTVRLTNLIGASNATFGGGSDVGAYRYGVTTGSALVPAYSWNGNAWDYYLYNTLGPSTPARAAMSAAADNVVVWYGEMNEIKKRLGELRMGRQSSDDFWVRAYSGRFDVKPSGTSAYSQLMRGLEIGKDNPQAFAGGKKYTGFVAGSGKGDNAFTSGGSGATRSTYLGTYASWLNDDGAFFDLVGKYNWFRHSFDTPLLGGGSDSGAYRNQGLGLSAELGKRFSRPGGAFVEPAVELAALWAGKAGYTTANGLAVEMPATRSLQLRLGCTVGQKWQGKDGVSREAYVKGAWVNEFAGSSTVRVDSVGFQSSLKGRQWVTGLGFVEDTGRHQVYIDAEKSWGNTTSKKWGVNAGYRWKF